MKTWQQTYRSFAERHIDQQSLLRLLVSAAARKTPDNDDSELPSWVPDWRRPFWCPAPIMYHDDQVMTSFDFKFNHNSEGSLFLEGYILPVCDNSCASKQQGVCCHCMLSERHAKEIPPKGGHFLCLPGSSIVFVVLSTAGGDSDEAYSLQGCFQDKDLGSEKARNWSTDLRMRRLI